MKDYEVTASIGFSFSIKASSEEEAKKKARDMSNEEIIGNLKTVFNRDCFEVIDANEVNN